MATFLESAKVFLKTQTWLIYLLPILGIAIFFTYTYYLFYQKIHPNLARKNYFITSALLEAIRWPLVGGRP